MQIHKLANNDGAQANHLNRVEAKPIREVVDAESGRKLAWEFVWNTGEREFLFADDFNLSIISR